MCGNKLVPRKRKKEELSIDANVQFDYLHTFPLRQSYGLAFSLF